MPGSWASGRVVGTGVGVGAGVGLGVAFGEPAGVAEPFAVGVGSDVAVGVGSSVGVGSGVAASGVGPGPPVGVSDPALGSTAGMFAALAGTRLADPAFHDVRTNGPEPTGCRLNGSSASVSIGTWSRRWTGRRPTVAAWRNPPIGVGSSNRTVLSSMAVTFTSRHDAPSGPV